ncbi:MAG: arginase family protein [Candidatus Woesearchaeota archaeon]
MLLIINKQSSSALKIHSMLDNQKLTEKMMLPAWKQAYIQSTEEIIKHASEQFITLGVSAIEITKTMKSQELGMLAFDARLDSCEAIIKESLMIPQKIIAAGVRSIAKSQKDLGNSIRVFTMRHIVQEGIHEACDSIMASSRAYQRLLVVVDLAVLEPSLYLDIGQPEPAGLTPRELIYLLQRIRILKNIAGFTITGFKEKIGDQTALLCAKIAMECY